MLPLSTGNTQGCKPISSNCVVWQGPDLNCINVCNGDTISIVIAKMAELVCTLIDTGLEASFDISNIVQSCVLNDPPSTDLQGLLQDMINTSCNNLNNITNLQNVVNILIEDLDEIELLQGPTGPAGPAGDPGQSSTIQSIIDNGDGTFTITYANGDTTVSSTIATIPGQPGQSGDAGAEGAQGDPGIPGNIKIPFPKCIFSGVGKLIDNLAGQEMQEGDFMLLQATFNDGNVNYNAYTEEIWELSVDGSTTIMQTYNYSGWADFVNQKLCCLLTGVCADQRESTGPSGDGTSSTGSDIINDKSIRNLPVITQLKNRIIAVERKGKAVYTPPKILARFVTNKVGQRVEMHELLSALEIDYGNLRKAIGSSSEVLKASRQQCINLSAANRLSGNGVMSTLTGWNNSPSTLAQAFSNAWKTICDMRTAVETLQTSVTPTGCSGFVYDPKISLLKDGGLGASAIKFLFTSMKIPEGYYDANKTKGSKITVEDSSFNSLVKFANVSNLQNSSNGFTIGNLATSGLDLTSNFKVKIEFAFTNGSNLCERIMDFTLENTSACPTVTLSTTGETAITYSVTGLSTVSKSTYEIIVEDQSGSVISKQTISEPSTVNTTGKASGLIAGTSYDIYVKTTSLAGNISTCDKTTFKTSKPACTSHSIVSSEYKTTYSEIGSTKKTVAAYTSGTTTTAWIVGFDTSTGNPCVYKGTESDVESEDGFNLYTTSISDNPTTSINCGNVAYPATGMTTLMNSNENGWQYVDSLKQNGNTTYYIYALANTANQSIDQIVFCCDCKPSFVRTKYGLNTSLEKSVAYSPDKHAWYVVPGKDLRIPIDIVGYSTQTTPIKWNASSTLGGSTKFVLPTDTAYDSSLGGTVQLIYTPHSSRPTAGIDSIDVYAETDCTVGNPGNRTINTITVPIIDASTILNTDTDITVFIDTNVISEDEAVIIKTEIDEVKTVLQNSCSTWTGTINYVPIAGNNTGDYIEHTKAMVDMKAGGTGSVSVATGYSSVKSLPSYWTPGSSKGIPSTVYIISIIGDVNGKGNYGGGELKEGWGVQPTAKYKQNYDELLDILYINGSARTAWGTNNGCTYKKFDLKQSIIPVVSGSLDKSAAAVLQVAGALTGTVLSDTGLKGFPTGSVKNPININDYIGPNSSQMVPYTGLTVTGSNTIIGLYNYGFRVLPYIDKTYLEADSNLYAGGNQTRFLGNAIKRLVAADSSGMELSNDAKCPVGIDNVQVMAGTLNGAVVNTYGNNQSDATNCAKAGSAATTASNCVPLYNSTGLQFDPSVPAFLTIAGGNAKAATDQPADGAYYAQHGPSAQDKVRRIAQYDRDGATTGKYWINIKYVSDC